MKYLIIKILNWALKRGHLEVAKFLLDHGADVNARDGFALIEASVYGHLEVAKLLLDYGADVNARDGSALIEASGHDLVELLKKHT